MPNSQKSTGTLDKAKATLRGLADSIKGGAKSASDIRAKPRQC